jgi:uncharacterized membrane protein
MHVPLLLDMNASRLVAAALLLFIMIDIAVAATLHGSIYDIELNELNNVVVEVDSEPNQRYVSKDGMYSFELNPGEYTITARYSPDDLHEYSTEDNVSIEDDGDFVYDLFLFPGFDAEDEALLDEPDLISPEDTNIDVNGQVHALTAAIIAIVFIIVLLVLYFIIGYFRNKGEKEELEEVDKATGRAREALKEELDDASLRKLKDKSGHKKGGHKMGAHQDVADADLQKVIEIIRKEGGRTTQKELRKQIPLSEAKISLMISELEHKRIVQKVKKGRGNIIILKRK